MMHSRNWLWILLAIGGVILLLLIALFYLFGPRPYRITETALKPGPRGEINILIIGKDARALNPAQEQGGITRIPRQKVAHSDIVIVCHINLNLGRVTLLAIPRDLLVIAPGIITAVSNTNFNQMEKLTHTYAIGGEPLLRSTVENLLGIKIHRFITFDFDSFRMAFRLLRSVLGPINLGQIQISDPDQALKFVRQRNNLRYDDLDRCRNTLNLLKTLAIRLWFLADTRVADILLNRFFAIIGPDTDLLPPEVRQLISQLCHQGFKPQNLRLVVLVSEGRPVTLDRYAMTLSCYLPIYPEIEKQIEHYLKDRNEINALDFMTQQHYSWPGYMTLNYDLLPEDPLAISERQRLVKEILEKRHLLSESISP